MTDSKEDKPVDPTKVCGTAVSIDLLKDDICKTVGITSDLTSWSAEEIGAGKGFLSVMAKIQLDWAKSDEKLPKTVIAKIPTTNKLKMVSTDEEMIKVFSDELYKIHNCEVSVYEVLADSPISLPKVFGLRGYADLEAMKRDEPAYIIMEDLSGPCTHHDLMMCDKLTDKQQEQVVCELARLHSWGLVYPDKAKLIKVLNFNEFMDKFESQIEKSFNDFVTALKKPDWIKALGEDKVHRAESLKLDSAYLKNVSPEMHKKHNIPDMLCHGDIHVNNMFFYKDNEGKATGDLHALIDWQIAHMGNPMDDVVKAISWLADPKQRTTERRTELLKVYYEEFKKGLGNVKCQFTYDDLEIVFWQKCQEFGRMMVVFSPQFVGQLQSGAIPCVDKDVAVERMFDDVTNLYVDTLDMMDRMKLE